LSELRLQLAADLRLALWDAEQTAMQVRTFNAQQREQLGDEAQFIIDFQDDVNRNQDVVNMIRRLEQPSYVRGLRRF